MCKSKLRSCLSIFFLLNYLINLSFIFKEKIRKRLFKDEIVDKHSVTKALSEINQKL